MKLIKQNKIMLQNLFEKLTKGDRLTTFAYAILVVIVLIFIITTYKKTSPQEVYKNKNGSFSLSSAIQGVGRDYSMDFSKKDKEKDYRGTENNVTKDILTDLITTRIYLNRQNIKGEEAYASLQIVAEKYRSLATGKVYMSDDIKIDRTDDKASNQAYYLEISTILKDFIKHEQAKPANLAKIKNTATSSRATLSRKFLEGESLYVDNILSQLLNVNATEKGSVPQLGMINYFSKYSSYLHASLSVREDPLKYMTFEESYLDTLGENFIKFVLPFNKYFESRGIVIN